MTTLVFQNPGEIDLRSISTFGVSVKESDNPIGFFGTGLKYAIAVLIRSGHEISIYSGETIVRFGLAHETVRGQEFAFVTMAVDGDEPRHIGFTTELGKTWQLWMAYREIACNCKDEGGLSLKDDGDFPEGGMTKIVVTGEEFAQIHNSRGLYLLEDQADFEADGVEIRRYQSKAMFYRGVRVMDYQKPAMFTYNKLTSIELTEDRTVKHEFYARMAIACSVLTSDDDRFIRDVVTAKDDWMEHGLNFHGWGTEPSESFLNVISDLVQDRISQINRTAHKVWMEATKHLYEPREIGMTKVQLASMEKALTFCEGIGFPIRGSYPIKVVEALGEGVLGLAHNQTIYIAERVFHLGGTKQLASTLIEEYLHLRQGWADLTRELQSFLFDKVVSLGEELMGEPL